MYIHFLFIYFRIYVFKLHYFYVIYSLTHKLFVIFTKNVKY